MHLPGQDPPLLVTNPPGHRHHSEPEGAVHTALAPSHSQGVDVTPSCFPGSEAQCPTTSGGLISGLRTAERRQEPHTLAADTALVGQAGRGATLGSQLWPEGGIQREVTVFWSSKGLRGTWGGGGATLPTQPPVS